MEAKKKSYNDRDSSDDSDQETSYKKEVVEYSDLEEFVDVTFQAYGDVLPKLATHYFPLKFWSNSILLAVERGDQLIRSLVYHYGSDDVQKSQVFLFETTEGNDDIKETIRMLIERVIKMLIPDEIPPEEADELDKPTLIKKLFDREHIVFGHENDVKLFHEIWREFAQQYFEDPKLVYSCKTHEDLEMYYLEKPQLKGRKEAFDMTYEVREATDDDKEWVVDRLGNQSVVLKSEGILDHSVIYVATRDGFVTAYAILWEVLLRENSFADILMVASSSSSLTVESFTEEVVRNYLDQPNKHTICFFSERFPIKESLLLGLGFKDYSYKAFSINKSSILSEVESHAPRLLSATRDRVTHQTNRRPPSRATRSKPKPQKKEEKVHYIDLNELDKKLENPGVAAKEESEEAARPKFKPVGAMGMFPVFDPTAAKLKKTGIDLKGGEKNPVRKASMVRRLSTVVHAPQRPQRPAPLPEEELTKKGYKISVPAIVPVQSTSEKSFTAYMINVNTGTKEYTVLKRYSQFHELDKQLAKKYKNLPKFPSKKIIGNLNEEFVSKRRLKIENYMQTLVSRSDTCVDPLVIEFVSTTITPPKSSKKRESKP